MSLLQMSIPAGIMIIVVTIIRVFAINHLPKITFPILWGIVLVRLLLPFSWTSPISLYALVSRSAAAQFINHGAVPILPFSASAETIIESGTRFSPWPWIWGIGAALCALYFIIAYVSCRRAFMSARPAVNPFTVQWLKEHKTKRHITIKQSDKILAPLTYGIFRPVILMPEQTDWADTQRLQYILTHEYIHIRHFDGVIKFVLAAAQCIHWFNPLVWVMFILANRDIELFCDEKVINLFGENTKSTYALALIDMEEKKSRFTPLCSNFSKNPIEERIKSIMKTKKPTITMLLAAALLIGSVTTVFATSSIKKDQTSTAANTVVYNTAEVRHYTDGGAPYIFWQRTNHTEQAITNIQFAMLAFDKNGNPLNLPWSAADSSAGYSYDALCQWEPKNLKPTQQADSNDGYEEGGWSLGWSIDIFEKNTPELRELFQKAAYILCCDKQIIFEDGTTWNNPDYDLWSDTYKGKKTNISILQTYYPNEQKITK